MSIIKTTSNFFLLFIVIIISLKDDIVLNDAIETFIP